MNSSWLLFWGTDEEKPTVEYPRNEETVSFAAFPESEQSFVLFEGYLFDRHQFGVDQNASDASRIAEYYTKYGDDLFPKLRGGFSFIIWDANLHRLIAGRDHIGLVPFYYYWDHKKIIISSSMQALLKHTEVVWEFNRVVIAEHLLHRWTDHQRTETFFENIQRLPPAHFMKLDQHHLSSVRYWDPIPPGFEWVTEQEAQTFPIRFEQAVNRCLEVGADSIALSGGFDSVSIAVMANELLQFENKTPLHAISIRYLNSGADEGAVQTAVAQALEMPQTIRSIDKSLAGESVLQASLSMSKISPIPVINIWQSFFSGLLDTAAKHNYNKMLMGTGGDEMFIVDPNWAYDLLSTFQLKKLAHYYRTIAAASPAPRREVVRVLLWERAIKPILMSIARKRLGRVVPKIRNTIRADRPVFPQWISTQDKRLIGSLKFRLRNPVPIEMAPEEGAYVRSIRKLPLSPLLMIEIEQAYFRAKHSGFSFFYPYFDLDLMELALRMNPEYLLKDGLAKAPLRHFVHNRIPSVKLPKKKVDFTQTAHGLLRSEGKEAWLKLGNTKILGNLGIIDHDNLNIFMNDYFNGVNNHWINAWLTISTETWLRTYST
jgi:asparagine synthetase B (glutamine-hydrolysing)